MSDPNEISRYSIAGRLMNALQKSGSKTLQQIWVNKKREQMERRNRHAENRAQES